MAKLHEILAVETELGNTDAKLSKESIKTLGKESLFMGQVRNLVMFDANEEHLNTTERQELTTTVDENLNYLLPHIAQHWDAIAQKDATNQEAKGDIIINGSVIAEGLPVTFLLGLETKLARLRVVLEAIPTLAPGISWLHSDQDGPGVYITEHTEKTFKTEKDMQIKTATKATKEHPEQFIQLATTRNVGEYELTKKSGMYSPARKAEVLNNLDILRNAVKKARMRANNTELVDIQIGAILLEFITG